MYRPADVSEPAGPTYRRAIIALAGGDRDERVIRLVAEQTRTQKTGLVGVHVVEIEWSMPLDAEIASRSEEVQQVLDHAELVAETLKIRLDPVLLQAREVGAALVDEAAERHADLLIVSLPYRKRFGGDFAIGRTVPYVLKHAPCAVWVVREPMSEEAG
jgi:nucleotide-binding universal stress UspA family protein